MLKNLVLLLIVSAVLARYTSKDALTKRKFEAFKIKFNKSYSPEEEATRFQIFKESMLRSEMLQKVNPKARFGVTKFSDLTKEEFASRYLDLGLKDRLKSLAPIPAKDFSAPGQINALNCKPDPKNYDWGQDCGVVTDVKNQGQCGSCWAFSATETIESYYALAGYTMQDLAPEQIVDCDIHGEDQGCNGGYPWGGYKYVQAAGGLDSESAYPYTAGEGESGSCQATNGSNFVATLTGYLNITGEKGLYQQLSSATGGPVSVCVDASEWQDYEGGVLTSCGEDVDHAVQATGYSDPENGGYWIVRNSWAEDWGEDGYIWIQAGSNLCEIGSYATIITGATAAKN